MKQNIVVIIMTSDEVLTIYFVFFRAQLQNVLTKMDGVSKKSQSSEKDLKTISLALGAVQTQLKVPDQ